ncbi:carboxylesterase family protein [Amycolatopsis sp. NPDC051061]|uniref:carboxylesterase/lipase family protein n=1 Tax=Amycolatopsis sp. NPDC051061 TaxID=3155042 RepID=UPI0034483104
MHRILSRAAVAVTALLTLGTGVAAAAGSSIVHTADGAVRGTVAENHRVFSGIPYAQPPVGSLRWRAPQPAKPWSGVLDATDPGPDCLQSGSANTSEDCLHLNVWTPRDANPASRLPVAVWIYGGAFRSGAARGYQPVEMVNQGGMLVVTLNYRVGAVGFLTLPQLDADNGTASGDYGQLDQIQALRWVKDNIARFGGDPGRVMVAGQSAGGESVCMLLASPLAAGLFSSAVVESGLTCGQNTIPRQQSDDAAFVASLGCGGMNSRAVMACLRGKTPVDVLAAQQAAGNVWYPVVGTRSLPVQPPTAFATGRFNHVPVLIGSTSAEGASFIHSANPNVTEADYRADVQGAFGDRADEVFARYPLDAYPVPGAAEAAIKTDVGFSCATLSNAALLAAAVPTYVYEFRDPTAAGNSYGAPQHAAELPYLWGTSGTASLTRTQQQLSQAMIAYWAEFARTGGLKVRGLPSVPRYSASAPHEVAFTGAAPVIVHDEAADHQCSYWGQVYPDGWPFHFGF